MTEASDHVPEGVRALGRLRDTFALSFDELGALLGTSGETVRRWERGLTEIPVDPAATLTGMEDALDRLARLFKPDRLKLVVRRNADLFGGERALDCILRRRLGEVVSRYEQELRYQA